MAKCDTAKTESARLPAGLAARLSPGRPVLIAGPTASGKSALALEIARHLGGEVVNADALQVHADWRVLTARPSRQEEEAVPHRLYGHVPREASYSVGAWLRDVEPLLTAGAPTPVIVGGTGLYLSALTQGLNDIPQTPAIIRKEAVARLEAKGLAALVDELRGRDPATLAGLDAANPARVLRAWEVLRATGRGLSDWQAAPKRPLLPLSGATALMVNPPRDVLAARIAARFDAMLAGGALDEVRAALPHWQEGAPWTRAIGAAELRAHLEGALSLEEARDRAIVASRRYAKRQRTWLRARMGGWEVLPAS
ncbi:MAG: tRNA (adenosine(37)-N6)-dimethylallyltransferase MiaA [Rhodobacteraceae bacterium]|nr:tRNA (adenosine(37)-N6)-dimethylallyltransferase MiaA [Paracoccaceae bacterium]